MNTGKIDIVSNPRHYLGDGTIDCMTAMKSMMTDTSSKVSSIQAYYWGCAFKYIWRWVWKNKVQDLKKCVQYLEFMIAEEESSKDDQDVKSV